MIDKFWNFVQKEDGETELYLEGTIASESWFDDDVTPEEFKAELKKANGNIRVVINSPGGDCVAASVIYTALMEYPHDVTVFITGLAASAASVIAMAGTKVVMSPTAMMMIHNPWTLAIGDKEEMKKAAHLLDEVKESIVNAYEIKTGLPRQKIETLMDNETWFSAHKAKELGFCDEVAYTQDSAEEKEGNFIFSGRAAAMALGDKLMAKAQEWDSTVTTAKINDAAITTAKIDDAAISSVSISAGKITTNVLTADQIAGGCTTTDHTIPLTYVTTTNGTYIGVSDVITPTIEVPDGLVPKGGEKADETAEDNRVNAADLLKRLALIKNY